MHPIRGERQRQVAHDPWAFEESNLGETDTTHVVSDAGAVESFSVVRQHAAGCGCLAPPKGYCAVCSKTACAHCFGFCCCCRMPLCPRHSVFCQRDGAESLRFCRSCNESSARKRIVRSLTRSILSVFIRFEDEHGQK